MWWTCPRFRDIRERVWKGAVPKASDLPPCLRNCGLAPQMIIGNAGEQFRGARAAGQSEVEAACWPEVPECVRAVLQEGPGGEHE
eukprot:12178255-Alexandrium_andersonii.AAC.1